jgi:hypothetical protein
MDVPSSSHLAAGAIEPLEANLWVARFDLMAERLRKESQPLEPVLRHVFHLVQLTPLMSRHRLAIALPEKLFEALLDARCYDAAALGLVGRGMSLNVRHRPGAHVAVTLALGEEGASGKGEGAELARAFLRAYCRCVSALAMVMECGAAPNFPPQAARAGSRRRMSTH